MQYDGVYFTGWRGGLGFVYLSGKTAVVWPVLFDAEATFEAWRINTLSIPLRFLIEVERQPPRWFDRTLRGLLGWPQKEN